MGAQVEQKKGAWTLQVVAYDTPDGQSVVGPDGAPTGTPVPIDMNKLLDALTEFADAAGQRLNSLDVSGGLVLTLGVTTGVSVSMTWTYQDSYSVPRGGRTMR
jgi:hypothetical protein